MSDEDNDRGLAAAVAGLGGLVASIVLGVLVAPFRDQVGLENVAILYVAIVAAAGAVGSRLGGFIAAVSAALSFNFFFTTPYGSLRIDSAEQVITVLLLFVAGLVAGLAGDVGRRLAERNADARHRDETAALALLGGLLRANPDDNGAQIEAVDGLQRLLRARWVALVPAGAPAGEPLAAAGTPVPAAERLDVPRLDGHALAVGPAGGGGLPERFLVPAGADRALLVVPGAHARSNPSVRVGVAAAARLLGSP